MDAARTACLDALRDLGGAASRREILDAAAVSGTGQRALSAALTALKREGVVENPGRGVWRITPPRVSEARLATLRSMPFAEYLRSPEWRQTRAETLLAGDGACAFDVRHTTDLVVHHRSTEHLGAERPEDLVLLCHACHRLLRREFGYSTEPRAVPASASVAPPLAAAEPAPPAAAGRAPLFSRLLARR